jgi:hypothetical protein
MMGECVAMTKMFAIRLCAAAGLALAAIPAGAQVKEIDPNTAVAVDAGAQAEAQGQKQPTTPQDEWQPVDASEEAPAAESEAAASAATSPAAAEAKVPRKDVFAAAEGVFGKGAEGLADVIEDLLRKQGEPNAYITGREAGGAFIAGVRYGSGTLHHQVEGDRPVFWTGPSLGFDFGADAAKVFVLVYNLHDSQRLFRRFPAAEGNAYVIGGFTASYLRRGDVVLIPVRMGVGARLGVNAGYMRFSQKNRWLPF